MIPKKLISKDFITIDSEETVSKLLGKLKKAKKNNAVVVREKRAVGVINRRKLLKSRIKIDEAKVKNFVKRVSPVNANDDVHSAVRKMAFSDVHMLPFIDKEKIPKGVVYAMDVAKLLPELQMHRKLGGFEKNKLIMFRDDASVGKAINTMRLGMVEHAPIVDKTGKLTGVLAAVDILSKYNQFPRKRPGGKRTRKLPKDSLEKEKTLVKLPVSNFSSRTVVSAHRNETVRKALKLMNENHVSDVIIVNDFDEPKGILTLKDIVDLVAVYLEE